MEFLFPDVPKLSIWDLACCLTGQNATDNRPTNATRHKLAELVRSIYNNDLPVEWPPGMDVDFAAGFLPFALNGKVDTNWRSLDTVMIRREDWLKYRSIPTSNGQRAYIRKEPDGREAITSLAHWLTPEGINTFHAVLIRDWIETLSDEEFSEVFDGASKKEAREFLEKWEFCHMPHWGPEEVAHAITMSESGRNQSFVLRAVVLAQKAGDLPEAFTPSDGIEWALQNGYLITRELRELASVTAWVLVSPPRGNASIEKPPLEPAPPASVAPPKEPVSAPRKAAILSWLRANGYDPQNFPKFSCRAPGGKAAVKEAMLALRGLGFTDSTFEGAWEELRKAKEIRDKDE